MTKFKKLPDAEFEIMKVVWANEPPITTNIVMQQLGNEREWKAQTTISLMLRLVERGFLRTEKIGKERTYYPLVKKEDYLEFETGNFLKQFHNNSFFNLVASLSSRQSFTAEEIDELQKWVNQQKGT
ncbi:MAG: BlaI/MecI/CopY family transcriptional regulator [Defluviitaleaceae bacterium]|nr:BlaI/MecI/CopY family transcriptional regulator [Defluviitaleaceae bacterium]MCL2274750.1 BlaI/MecI/CopY family transcriptional regulator [Defluviitaleaceae bacterium]